MMKNNGLPPIRLWLGVLMTLMLIVTASRPAYAASTINVTTTADENGTGAGCSLREAITTANNNSNFGGCTGAAGGPFTINVPAGTYNLSASPFELQVGTSSGRNITIAGAGAANTIIHQTIANQRVFDLDPNVSGSVTVNISGVTISGGTGTAFGGGGILGGGTNDSTTLTGVIITGNTTSGGSQGGGIGWGGGGNLTIANSKISNNTSDLTGGGIAFNQTSNVGNLTITKSTISGNIVNNASGGLGGGLLVTGLNIITISNSMFVNNILNGGTAVNQHGGAIDIDGGTLNLSFSRIAGNTAGNGKGLYVTGGATANAADNWWGCNGGPGAAGCDDVQGPGIKYTNPWLMLSYLPIIMR